MEAAFGVIVCIVIYTLKEDISFPCPQPMETAKAGTEVCDFNSDKNIQEKTLKIRKAHPVNFSQLMN